MADERQNDKEREERLSTPEREHSFREGLLILNSEQDEILFINQSAENIFNGGLMFENKPRITINHFRTERKFKLVDFEDLDLRAQTQE